MFGLALILWRLRSWPESVTLHPDPVLRTVKAGLYAHGRRLYTSRTRVVTPATGLVGAAGTLYPTGGTIKRVNRGVDDEAQYRLCISCYYGAVVWCARRDCRAVGAGW